MDPDLKEYLDRMFVAITEQIGRVDQRLERLEQRVERIEQRVERLEQAVAGMRVVAELGPPQGGTADFGADALLADAVRSGWLRPPVLPAQMAIPPRLPVAPLSDVLAELDRDRADR